MYYFSNLFLVLVIFTFISEVFCHDPKYCQLKEGSYQNFDLDWSSNDVSHFMDTTNAEELTIKIVANTIEKGILYEARDEYKNIPFRVKIENLYEEIYVELMINGGGGYPSYLYGKGGGK